jgi:hypothetical protein
VSAIDERITRERFELMTDEALQRVVLHEREDYVERALEIAAEELATRNVAGSPYRDGSVVNAEPPGHRLPGLVYADLYVALLALGVVGGPLVSLWLRADLDALALQIGAAAIMVPVLVGLRRRRLWAWWLNWIVLVLLAMRFLAIPGNPGFIVGGAWFLLNARYFYRRKLLFKGSRTP